MINIKKSIERRGLTIEKIQENILRVDLFEDARYPKACDLYIEANQYGTSFTLARVDAASQAFWELTVAASYAVATKSISDAIASSIDTTRFDSVEYEWDEDHLNLKLTSTHCFSRDSSENTIDAVLDLLTSLSETGDEITHDAWKFCAMNNFCKMNAAMSAPTGIAE